MSTAPPKLLALLLALTACRAPWAEGTCHGVVERTTTFEGELVLVGAAVDDATAREVVRASSEVRAELDGGREVHPAAGDAPVGRLDADVHVTSALLLGNATVDYRETLEESCRPDVWPSLGSGWPVAPR